MPLQVRYGVLAISLMGANSGSLAMWRYAIVVSDAGSKPAACVTDLPGCVAAGETGEVGRLIREPSRPVDRR